MGSAGEFGTALITGASAGIGAVYADRLAHRGFDLILVARDHDKLNAQATKIHQETGRKVTVIAADLNEKYDVGCVEEILRSDPDIAILVNNAGVGSTAKLLDADIERMEAMIGLNVLAMTRLTYAIVPRFVARNRGALINISSIVAISPETLNGVYGGTKAFVLAFSQSLKQELSGTAVRVQAVLPGGTRTDFFSVAGTPIDQMSDERRNRLMSPEDLVDSALAGFDMGEFITLPALPDQQDWDNYEAARQIMIPKLSRSEPAVRYRGFAKH